MDQLQVRIDQYFDQRTRGKQGAIKDYITTQETQHSIHLGENDYLSLSNHETVIKSQIDDLTKSIRKSTTKCSSSVFLTKDDPHSRLEHDMGK
jgi:7-keto-8-aminopelargonate synthetase-like enzyme